MTCVSLFLRRLLPALLALTPLLLSAQTVNPNYDAALADSLGGDEIGMKTFVLAILRTGENTSADPELIKASFRGHLDNISRLANEGKLALAGPLAKNDKAYRGIIILNVDNLEAAQELLDTDPAIHEKLLTADLYIWYGSAALPTHIDVADRIWQKKP